MFQNRKKDRVSVPVSRESRDNNCGACGFWHKAQDWQGRRERAAFLRRPMVFCGLGMARPLPRHRIPPELARHPNISLAPKRPKTLIREKNQLVNHREISHIPAESWPFFQKMPGTKFKEQRTQPKPRKLPTPAKLRNRTHPTRHLQRTSLSVRKIPAFFNNVAGTKFAPQICPKFEFRHPIRRPIRKLRRSNFAVDRKRDLGDHLLRRLFSRSIYPTDGKRALGDCARWRQRPGVQ